MCFVVNAKLLLLYKVISYYTQLMFIPNEILITKTKKFYFIVRLLYFVYIRSVLKLKYGSLIVTCSVHHTPVLFND